MDNDKVVSMLKSLVVVTDGKVDLDKTNEFIGELVLKASELVENELNELDEASTTLRKLVLNHFVKTDNKPIVKDDLVTTILYEYCVQTRENVVGAKAKVVRWLDQNTQSFKDKEKKADMLLVSTPKVGTCIEKTKFDKEKIQKMIDE